MKPRHEGPDLMRQHEVKLGCINAVSFIAGIGMLFVAVGWWGLAGIVIYWLLVVFVLLPFGMQRLLLLIFSRDKQTDLEYGGGKASNSLYDLPKLEQMPDEEKEKDNLSPIKAMSNEDLLALKEKYPNNESVAKLIDGILEARAKVTLDDLERDMDELEQAVERAWTTPGALEPLPDSDLLAIKERHRSSESIVKMIDDILEARAKTKRGF